MIDRLTSQFPQHDSSATVRRGIPEYVEKQRPRQVKAAARREQKPAGRKQLHCAQVYVLVTADRSRQRWLVLRERRRVQYDGVVPGTIPLALVKKVESVSRHEVDVAQIVPLRIL